MTSDWSDQFYSLFNWCGSLQAKATCGGNTTITLDGLGNSTSLSIESLDYGESCTYGFVAQCGYPKIEIDRSDLDVVVAYLNTSSTWKLNDTSFRFPPKWTQALQAVGDKINYVYGNWTQEGRDESCGKNRTIIVTITNLNKPAKEDLATAGQVKNVGVTFSSVPDNAVTKMVSAIMFALCAMLLL